MINFDHYRISSLFACEDDDIVYHNANNQHKIELENLASIEEKNPCLLTTFANVNKHVHGS
jgi:hypothetical protein